jgi:flagellar biogenesis protein FliO
MIVTEQKIATTPTEVREDFNWGATIGVLILILAFISAIFYVLVSSMQDLG